MTQAKRVVWVFALILLAGGSVQYANFLSQGPASQYREYYSHTRFPDISVYVADAQFNLTSRSITYRLQVDIMTSRYQGAGLGANFVSSLTGGFSIYLNSTRWGENGANVSYYANQVGTKDELYGLSELYPYDIYKAQYRVTISTRSPFDFSQNFVPYVFAYMKYPESLNWEIQASATSVNQDNSSSGSLLSFELNRHLKALAAVVVR